MADRFDMQLVWDSGARAARKRQMQQAQVFVDSETIRLMKRYTPARNMFLSEKAPVLGTRVGAGRIYYLAPYARYQYYGRVMVSRVTGSPWARHGEAKVITDRALRYSTLRHPEAQARWFETVKTKHRTQILRGAAAIAGGRALTK